MKRLTTQEAIKLYNLGHILVNNSDAKPVMTFKLKGKHYSTTQKRSTVYRFNSRNWHLLKTRPGDREKVVLSGKAREINLTQKAIAVGVK